MACELKGPILVSHTVLAKASESVDIDSQQSFLPSTLPHIHGAGCVEGSKTTSADTRTLCTTRAVFQQGSTHPLHLDKQCLRSITPEQA